MLTKSEDDFVMDVERFSVGATAEAARLCSIVRRLSARIRELEEALSKCECAIAMVASIINPTIDSNFLSAAGEQARRVLKAEVRDG